MTSVLSTAMCAEMARGDRGSSWWAQSMEYSARSNCLVALYMSNRRPTPHKGRLITFDLNASDSVLCNEDGSMCAQHVANWQAQPSDSASCRGEVRM